jgi:hypothetical protein
LLFRIAQELWGADAVTTLEKRVREASAVDEHTPSVIWASTVPAAPLRSALYQVLKKTWDEGPKALDAAGLLDKINVEPGFLVVLKSQDRSEPLPTRTAAAGAGGPGAGSGRRAKAAEAAAAAAKTKQEGEKKKGEWMRASEKAVRAMCRRMYVAATAAGPAPGEAEAPPFELAPKGDVLAELHLRWPRDAAEKLPGLKVGPIKIDYLRVRHDHARAASLMSHYKAKLHRPSVRNPENGEWVETFRDVPHTNRKESVDVLILLAKDVATKPTAGGGAGPMGGNFSEPASGGGPPAGGGMRLGGGGTRAAGVPGSALGNEPADLVVEILSIEMPNPVAEESEE